MRRKGDINLENMLKAWDNTAKMAGTHDLRTSSHQLSALEAFTG